MLLTKKEITEYTEACLKQIDKGIARLGSTIYTQDIAIDGVYVPHFNGSWLSGFWTGLLMLSYEASSEPKYRSMVEKQIDSFYDRIKVRFDVRHHDMGFVYSPSCVAAYKLWGDEKAREAAVMAADCLCSRYLDNGGYIKAWGEMSDPVENRIIIDCLMNLPLLFWAYEETGNERYREVAENHLKLSARLLIRADGTTHHTYMMDLREGNPICPKTDQGYNDNSVWSRGQAWAIYGLTLAYSYTKDESLLKSIKMVTDKFIELLPEDNVPAWDMIFTDIYTLKDTSASAIASCGILEFNKHSVGDAQSEMWNEKAHDMLRALGEHHLIKNDSNPDSSALLRHGTQWFTMDGRGAVNVGLIYGDYFFMEALVRLLKPDWNRYW